MAQILSIDGVDYDVEKMSDTAKKQIYNIRATDQEISRTRALLSMLETARRTYSNALKSELEHMSPEGSVD